MPLHAIIHPPGEHGWAYGRAGQAGWAHVLWLQGKASKKKGKKEHYSSTLAFFFFFRFFPPFLPISQSPTHMANSNMSPLGGVDEKDTLSLGNISQYLLYSTSP